MYEEYDFIDDVSGQLHDHRHAKEARKLEIEFLRRMKVYEKLPRTAAAQDGCKIITTRRIDINKGDATSPNYRARLVGRETRNNTHQRLDLFVAMPSLEALRFICDL